MAQQPTVNPLDAIERESNQLLQSIEAESDTLLAGQPTDTPNPFTSSMLPQSGDWQGPLPNYQGPHLSAGTTRTPSRGQEAAAADAQRGQFGRGGDLAFRLLTGFDPNQSHFDPAELLTQPRTILPLLLGMKGMQSAGSRMPSDTWQKILRPAPTPLGAADEVAEATAPAIGPSTQDIMMQAMNPMKIPPPPATWASQHSSQNPLIKPWLRAETARPSPAWPANVQITIDDIKRLTQGSAQPPLNPQAIQQWLEQAAQRPPKPTPRPPVRPSQPKSAAPMAAAPPVQAPSPAPMTPPPAPTTPPPTATGPQILSSGIDEATRQAVLAAVKQQQGVAGARQIIQQAATPTPAINMPPPAKPRLVKPASPTMTKEQLASTAPAVKPTVQAAPVTATPKQALKPVAKSAAKSKPTAAGAPTPPPLYDKAKEYLALVHKQGRYYFDNLPDGTKALIQDILGGGQATYGDTWNRLAAFMKTGKT